MANVPLTFGGGSGSGSDDCTGTKAQALAGYTFITHDSDDEPVAGQIVTKNDSGNTTLTPASQSKVYSSGYYPSSHGATINPQSKSVTPSTSQQTVAPDSGRVLSGVTVNAIPGQTAGGTVTLTSSHSSETRSANSFLTSALTVTVNVYNGSVT